MVRIKPVQTVVVAAKAWAFLLLLLLLLIFVMAAPWTTLEIHAFTSQRLTNFRHKGRIKHSTSSSSPPSVAVVEAAMMLQLSSQTILDSSSAFTWTTKGRATNLEDDLEKVLKRHGFPWKSSIDTDSSSNAHQSKPFYQPFFEWQLMYMKKNLHNLRLVRTTDRSKTKDLTYVDNLRRIEDGRTKRKPHRMMTICFTSDEYRLIRMTLLDGGSSVQVFTSLWYPNGHVNMPVLGIDLLQFSNATRHLTVVDFQPIQPSEQDHDLPYEHLLEPIRNRYPSLQHTMSRRFYDESDGFFSKQMLLGKGQSTEYVFSELWPAYQDYVETHTYLVKKCLKNNNINNNDNFDDMDTSSGYDRERNNQKDPSAAAAATSPLPVGLQGQKRYDDYSSVRDPAHGLLVSCFGKTYADDFVYDVLFPLCTRDG